MNKYLKAINYGFNESWLFIKALIPSLFFNFYYLPFKQAIKLPILIYKPHIHRFKGSITIDSPYIKTGMIRLGVLGGRMYPNNGIGWTHEGE